MRSMPFADIIEPTVMACPVTHPQPTYSRSKRTRRTWPAGSLRTTYSAIGEYMSHVRMGGRPDWSSSVYWSVLLVCAAIVGRLTFARNIIETGIGSYRLAHALATELLQLCERFFTNASPAVIAELRAFVIAEGVHPATALGCFTDILGFATYHPEPGKWPSYCAARRRAAESADAAIADVGGQR